jgi:hypothetical protein
MRTQTRRSKFGLDRRRACSTDPPIPDTSSTGSLPASSRAARGRRRPRFGTRRWRRSTRRRSPSAAPSMAVVLGVAATRGHGERSEEGGMVGFNAPLAEASRARAATGSPPGQPRRGADGDGRSRRPVIRSARTRFNSRDCSVGYRDRWLLTDGSFYCFGWAQLVSENGSVYHLTHLDQRGGIFCATTSIVQTDRGTLPCGAQRSVPVEESIESEHSVCSTGRAST